MAEKLIGTDIAPPDLIAKITGRAKYSEDFRRDGMVFAKLLLSPMPHCRVRGVDATRALAMPGVVGILRAEDVPQRDGPREAVLTDEPHYEGEPILAIAAETEELAAAAIEMIDLDLEPLPFVIDPLDSLRPGGPNAYSEGNRFADDEWTDVKWTEADFEAIDAGQMPDAQAVSEWSKGDPMLRSLRRTSSSTNRSCTSRLHTIPWSRAPLWPIGRTANSTLTYQPRVPRGRSSAWRGPWIWIPKM